jgi:hypothetical protein
VQLPCGERGQNEFAGTCMLFYGHSEEIIRQCTELKKKAILEGEKYSSKITTVRPEIIS